jgi:hypothetical protein
VARVDELRLLLAGLDEEVEARDVGLGRAGDQLRQEQGEQEDEGRNGQGRSAAGPRQSRAAAGLQGW